MAFSIKTSFGSRSILNDDRSSETAQHPSYDLPYSGSVPNLAQKHDSQSSRPQSLYFSSNGPISLPPPNFPSARSNVSTSSYTSPLDRRRSSDMTVLSKFKVDDGLLNDKYRNRHSMYYGDNHSSKGFQQQQPQSTYPLVPGDYTSSSSHSRNSSISHSNTTSSSYPFTMSHNNNVMMMDPKSPESHKMNNSKQASSITPVLGPKPSNNNNNNNSTNNSSTQKHQKKYVCGHCQRSFTTSGHLARHTRIHTGEKNYECPHADCNARFSRQDNCMQHYRTHLGGRSRGGNSSTGRGTRSRRSNTTSSSSSSTTSARPPAETPNTTIIPPPPPPTSSMVPPQHHQQRAAAAPQYSNQHLQMPPQYLSHGHNYQQPLSHHHHHHPSIPLVHHHHQQSSQPQQQQAATSAVKPVVSQRHILPMRN